jgi:hypothetical protein
MCFVLSHHYSSPFETGVLDLRPKLLGFHMSGLATCPYMPNKVTVMVKDKERRFITGLGHAMGRGRVSTQPIFSHLWGTDLNFRFK